MKSTLLSNTNCRIKPVSISRQAHSLFVFFPTLFPNKKVYDKNSRNNFHLSIAFQKTLKIFRTASTRLSPSPRINIRIATTRRPHSKWKKTLEFNKKIPNFQIFLSSIRPKFVESAFKAVLDSINESFISTLIIDFPKDECDVSSNLF